MVVCILMILTAFIAACGALPPEKDFTVTRYLMDTPVCLVYLNDNDEETITCPGDPDYPEDPIVKTLDDELKELNYEDLLINRCKTWR